MPIDFLAIAPEIALAVTALVVLAADLSLRGDAKQLVNPLAAIGTLVALFFVARLWGDERTTFAGTFVVDSFALTFKALFLLVLLAVLGISWRFFAEGRYFQGEYYFLLVTAFIGMLLMPSARDLLLLFVALETVSVPAFVMVGLRKRDLYSSEAALKFFLIGVLSVALMLLGMSFVYGFTGATGLDAVARPSAGSSPPAPSSRCCSPRSCSSSSGSASRSPPSRSTSGRPTPTPARRCPSPRCSPSRRRPPGSPASPSSASSPSSRSPACGRRSSASSPSSR
jgi:NADH-quinone oxidoreductase subunit N